METNNLTLYPFQKIGVRLIDRMKGNCLLADEPGLGKTIQVIEYLKMNKARPVLIVCPASVKIKWQREFTKWAPEEKTQVLYGKAEKQKIDPSASVIIVNWDIIHQPYKKFSSAKGSFVNSYQASHALMSAHFRTVVGDECHKIAKNKTGRTIAFKEVCKRAEFRIGVSGTPIDGRPINFYNILNLIRPDIFGNWLWYVREFCDLKIGRFGKDVSGASNLDQLHTLLSDVMIRRKKIDVLKDLPPKIRSVIPLEIDNRKEYEKAENEYIDWLEEKGKDSSKATHLTQLNHLEQLAIEGILAAAITWIEDYLESGEKLVVGCVHREINRKLMQHFESQAVSLIGGLGADERQSVMDRFQSDDSVQLAVCNIIAAGEGIDLYAARATCTIELMWDASAHIQFEDRVHRIGQTSDSVMAYYLVGADTVMEKKAAVLDKKQMNSSKMIDGEDVEDFNLLINLLKGYEKK